MRPRDRRLSAGRAAAIAAIRFCAALVARNALPAATGPSSSPRRFMEAALGACCGFLDPIQRDRLQSVPWQ